MKDLCQSLFVVASKVLLKLKTLSAAIGVPLESFVCTSLFGVRPP